MSSSPASPASVRPPWLSWIYTHNPFYAISAALMIYAVQAAYGRLEIGSINSWLMMGVLAGYTVVLAGIAVVVIRWGKVWEDARSLLLLLLLLFLAVSVSTDDLFANSPSPTAGLALMLSGLVGSIVLSEVVLRAARIRLTALLRWPYYLILALFYVAPWWCSPALHARSAAALEWTIFLFPTIAAVLLLMLVPAVRRGSDVAANNGTPWPWPWFPWTMYGVIVAAIAFRSFVLAMTFGPTGPIWKIDARTIDAINFDTIFGPYFLVPLAFAVLWVFLEGAIVSRSTAIQERVLVFTPALLLMAFPFSQNAISLGFFERFVAQCGSPVWLTGWLVLAIFLRAWIARVPGAVLATAVAMLLFTIVGPRTVGGPTLTDPQPWPLFVVAVIASWRGVRLRSSGICLVGAALFALGLALVLPRTLAAEFRMTICFHVLWAAVIVLGLGFRDHLAALLRIVGAVLMPVASVVVLLDARLEMVPLSWKLGYVAAVAVLALVLGGLFRERWYLFAFAGMMLLGAFGATLTGFRQAVGAIGRPAMTAIAWSAASLVIAFLISARKAKWLPPDFPGRWLPWTSPPALPPETPALEAPTGADPGPT